MQRVLGGSSLLQRRILNNNHRLLFTSFQSSFLSSPFSTGSSSQESEFVDSRPPPGEYKEIPHDCGENIKVISFLCQQDNYGFAIHCENTSTTTLIDCCEEDMLKVIDILDTQTLFKFDKVDDVLITHHHPDHIVGIPDLLSFFPDVRITVPLHEYEETLEYFAFKGFDYSEIFSTVEPGTVIDVGSNEAQVLDLSGHSKAQIGFYMPPEEEEEEEEEGTGLAILGDSLFRLACGRVFGGKLSDHFETVTTRIKELPPNTNILCGHDYAYSNALWYRSVLQDRISGQKNNFVRPQDDDNDKKTMSFTGLFSSIFSGDKSSENDDDEDIDKITNQEALFRVEKIIDELESNNRMSPLNHFSLKEELLLNPFLNSDSLEEFTALRHHKDNF